MRSPSGSVQRGGTPLAPPIAPASDPAVAAVFDQAGIPGVKTDLLVLGPDLPVARWLFARPHRIDQLVDRSDDPCPIL